MAISYVGGVASGRAGSVSTASQSLTGLAGGSDSQPAEGDLVVVFVSVGTAAAYQPTALAISGYSSEAMVSNTAVTNQSFSQISYKVQTATPDTSITIPSSGNIRNAQRWEVHVYRGVNPSIPFDPAIVTANGSATGRPNPAAVVPALAGAWIQACYASCAATGTAFTAPTDFATNWLGDTVVDTYDVMSGAGYYTGWSSGSYDPAAITAGGTTGATDSWTAHTLALRPSTSHTASISETGSSSDSTAADLFKLGETAESVSAVESLGAIMAYDGSFTEQGSAEDVTDATVTTSSQDGTITESTAASDTVEGLVQLEGATTETGSAVDTVASAAVMEGAATETGSAIDTVDANISAGAVSGDIVDSLTASSTESAVISFTMENNEATTALDVVSIFVSLGGTTNENVTVAETVDGTLALDATTNEVGSAIDTVDAAALMGASVAENGAAADVNDSSVALAGAAAEVLTALDTPQSSAVLEGAESETANAVDAPDATVSTAGESSTTEQLAATSTESSTAAFGLSVSEQGAASSTESGVVATEGSVAEQVSSIDTFDISALLLGATSEAVSADDVVTADGASVLDGSVSETISTNDTVDSAVAFLAATTDSLSAQDIVWLLTVALRGHVTVTDSAQHSIALYDTAPTITTNNFAQYNISVSDS